MKGKVLLIVHTFKMIFKNEYCVATFTSGAVMYLIVLLGNPHIGGFYLHFIPELFASYFIGLWTYHLRKVGLSLTTYDIWLMFLVGTIFPPLLLTNSSSTLVFFFCLCLSTVLSIPTLIGYYWMKFADKRGWL